MTHHFKVGDHVLGFNTKTEYTALYDVVAVSGSAITGSSFTLSLGYHAKHKGKSQVFSVATSHRLYSGYPDETLELIRKTDVSVF
jgi:hypothetical protein